MYLSELFLQELNQDYSAVSVRKALYLCNEEIARRLGPVGDLKAKCREYFGYEQETDENREFAELADFWDIYKEFDHILSLRETEELLIMKLVYVML